MASYACERRLPSCDVSPQLLREIERFILQKAETVAGNKSQSDNYNVEIEDGLGTQTLSSMEEFTHAQFLDDTQSVRLAYDPYGSPLGLDLKFAVDPDFSKVVMRIEGGSPRQTALGIWAELEHILSSHTNRHHFLAPRSAFFGGIVAVSWLLLFWGGVISVRSLELGTPFFLLGLTGIGYFSLKRVFPYTSFDSRRNQERQKSARWLFLGFLAFVIFSVVGVYFRRRLLGF